MALSDFLSIELGSWVIGNKNCSGGSLINFFCCLLPFVRCPRFYGINFSGASHICKKTFFAIPHSPFPIPKKRLIFGNIKIEMHPIFLQKFDVPQWIILAAKLPELLLNFLPVKQIYPTTNRRKLRCEKCRLFLEIV